MSLLSKRCEYGLRAALYLVRRTEGDGYVSIREISDELDVSFHFLTKILQQFTESGLLLSSRGPSGGVALARPAKRITLLDLVDCLEGPDLFQTCVLGLSGCGDRKPCPLHEKWVAQRKALRAFFSGTTLDALGQHTLAGGLRLAD